MSFGDRNGAGNGVTICCMLRFFAFRFRRRTTKTMTEMTTIANAADPREIPMILTVVILLAASAVALAAKPRDPFSEEETENILQDYALV